VRTAVRRGFAVLALVFASLAYLEFAWAPDYEFPPPTPFHGDRWYNPYAGYRGGGLRANFHAHSEAWSGLTFGDTPPRQLYGLYKALGYEVIGISDYMAIEGPQDPNDPYLSAYEHGYTPGRRHQTVIGAKRVNWLDYPLGASANQKQSVLDALRAGAPFVVINHPTKADSYAIDDMAKLTGYDAIEVATKYGVWEDFWDAALSAGRPVWGFAADDGHAQTESGSGSHVGIGSVVIHAQRDADDVLRALREGRFHALYTRQNEGPIALDFCEIDAGVLHVRVGEVADTIRFYGEHGALRSEERRKAEAVYTLRPDDPYVRVEVIAHQAVLYLNPVIRWDGVALPKPEARVRERPTWLRRGIGALVWLGAAIAIARSPLWRRAQRPVANST
jgi:hypothetical protein